MKDTIFSYAQKTTGNNHLKHVPEKPCEDFAGYCNHEKFTMCVVADGHGSDNYPRTNKGSEFAVKVALACVKQFVETIEKEDKIKDLLNDKNNNYPILKQLSGSILNGWHMLVEKHYKEHPFSDLELKQVSDKYKKKYLSDDDSERKIEKAYGTTLIFFVVTEYYSFGMQIGDGKCVLIDKKGDFSEPIPWDENCQMNVTTSICDANAGEEFRFYLSDEIPAAVFCGTDGVDDSYTSKEELYALYRTIVNIFVENGRTIGQNEIDEYLPILTKKGSGDDISIGTIMDFDLLEKISPILKMQTEYFQLQNEAVDIKRSLKKIVDKREELWKVILKYRKETQLQDGTIEVGIEMPDDSIMGEINALTKEYEKSIKRNEDITTRLSEIETCKESVLFEQEVASFEKDTINLTNESQNVSANIADNGSEEMKAEKNDNMSVNEETKQEDDGNQNNDSN